MLPLLIGFLLLWNVYLFPVLKFSKLFSHYHQILTSVWCNAALAHLITSVDIFVIIIIVNNHYYITSKEPHNYCHTEKVCNNIT
jgi:hypothetical protein